MDFLSFPFKSFSVKNFWSFVLFWCQSPTVLLETPYEAAKIKNFSPFSTLLIVWFFFQSKPQLVCALTDLYVWVFLGNSFTFTLDSLKKRIKYGKKVIKLQITRILCIWYDKTKEKQHTRSRITLVSATTKQRIHLILLSNNLLKNVQCGRRSQSGPLLSHSHIDASSRRTYWSRYHSTHILLIPPKLYYKSVSRKVTDFLR